MVALQVSMKKVSLCYAVYQNAGSLEELYLRSRKAIEENFPDLEVEFIFVNDGSTDSSLEELKAIKSRNTDHRIKIISFARNFGQMAAILAGWRFATGDAVINLAADLQDPPEQCVPMIREWLGGKDIVISYRETHATSAINKVTSQIAYRIMIPEAPKGGFDFALLSRKALDAVLSIKDRNRFYQHDLLWVGFDRSFLPYQKSERKAGRSQYSFFKRFGNFMTGYINVSYTPLRAMTILGALFAAFGLIYAISIVHAYLIHAVPFEGWAPIMMFLLIIGGLIMAMLGIIGEYIWRIFDEVKARPTYIVKEVV
jgi:glycosyltransferase involved in cell wall biosynthesis